jgi:hypothetical protein
MRGCGVLCGTTALTLAALTQGAAGQVFVDTFSNNTNEGGWTFGAPIEVISPAGGHPGAYLRGSGLDTTIPVLRTGEGVASPFVGNYRAAGVTQIGADIIVHSTDFMIGNFPLALILVSDNDTPGDPDDDWGAYMLNQQGIPLPGQGWRSFSFDVPRSATSLPTGWHFIQFGPNSPPSPSWNTLITGVSRLEFSFGDPELFYIFQMWDVGADNVLIAMAEPCYANCDGSTQPPILNVLDFVCFQSAYAQGSNYANCDGSTTPPILNVLDFVCFQAKYAAGCP